MKKLHVEFTNSRGTVTDPIDSLYDSSFGVLLFGVDGNPMLSRIHDHLSAILGSESLDLRFVLVLNGDESCDHKKRHESVMYLKKMGMDEVVGIYAKVNPPDSDPREDEEAWKRQARELLNNPPTPDGLAFLITVSVEEE